jgi:hypothetical protein
MFRRSEPATIPPLPANSAATHDVCLKCGRPTPLGVSLCEVDNPGHIKSPSTTQVHGTIVIGVIAGFVLLLVLFRIGSSGVGPFNSTLVGYTTRADGAFDVAITVTNTGDRVAGASCRISASGAPDFRDYTFFTEPIPVGESRTFTRTVPPAPNSGVLQSAGLVVHCS